MSTSHHDGKKQSVVALSLVVLSSVCNVCNKPLKLSSIPLYKSNFEVKMSPLTSWHQSLEWNRMRFQCKCVAVGSWVIHKKNKKTQDSSLNSEKRKSMPEGNFWDRLEIFKSWQPPTESKWIERAGKVCFLGEKQSEMGPLKQGLWAPTQGDETFGVCKHTTH